MHTTFAPSDGWAIRNSRLIKERLFNRSATVLEAVLVASRCLSSFDSPLDFLHRANSFLSLAWIELRLTIARLIWNFDIEKIPGYENWHYQNIYLGWQKVPLPIRLIPRVLATTEAA